MLLMTSGLALNTSESGVTIQLAIPVLMLTESPNVAAQSSELAAKARNLSPFDIFINYPPNPYVRTVTSISYDLSH
jgi:hypothetical protein